MTTTEAQFKKYQSRGRFIVEPGGRDDERRLWDLIDNLDGYCVTFFTRKDANDAKKLARSYVEKWGDIDLGSFPYDLNTPLSYCDDRYPPEDDSGDAYCPRPWPVQR